MGEGRNGAVLLEDQGLEAFGDRSFVDGIRTIYQNSAPPMIGRTN